MAKNKNVTKQALPLDLDTAAVICEKCIRAVTGFKDEIRAEDTLDKFAIDSELILTLVDEIINDEKIGVPSAGFKIPDPNKLVVKTSTKFFQLRDLLVKISVPK